MLSSDNLDTLMELIISQLGQGKANSTRSTPANAGGCPGKKKDPTALTPQKALVILGLIGGALEIRSVLVDRNQIIEVLLDGSLKRKTRLDKMMDEIGAMPFDDVLRAILGRAT